jgi:hypothetical protein
VLYCGRHDFGTRILKKTGNLKLVMQTMGHVDVKTAMKYQHPELDIVRSALKRHAARSAASESVAGSCYGRLYGTPGKTTLRATGKCLKRW